MAEKDNPGKIVHTAETRPDVLVHVAANVRRLRRRAKLSQQALADAANVSRRMLVNIEKGDVNVSLNTLDRLGEALNVLFYTLVAPPDTGDSTHINERVWAGIRPGSEARILASKAARHEVELWSWCLAPGEVYVSEPEPDGWHNMLYVTEGELTLTVDDALLHVAAGDFHVFASSLPHGFRNDTEQPVRFLRNIVY